MPIFINPSDLVYSAVVKKILNFATPPEITETIECGVPVVGINIPEYKLWYRVQSDINGKVWLGLDKPKSMN